MHRPAANHRQIEKVVNLTTIQLLILWSLTQRMKT